MLKCADCGSKFDRPGTRGKLPTLCLDCKKQRRRVRTNNWHRANPEKVQRHKKRKPPITTVICIECGLDFPRPGTFGPLRVRCAECKAVHLVRRQRASGMRRRLATYGITLEQYEEMLANQDGSCAICRSDWSSKGPNIDHDHSTGEVRGLLCQACNQAIGQLRDDPAIIIAAAEYVRRGGYAHGDTDPQIGTTLVVP